MSGNDLRLFWEEVGIIRHEILNGRTIIKGIMDALKKEKERFAANERSLNILIDKIEKLEKGSPND